MLQPFNINLNCAAHIFASRLWPQGWRLTHNGAMAAGTLKALQVQVLADGSPLVWKGASDNTIFADPETNWAFRAWHDWAHYVFALPFSLEGEAKAALVQCRQTVERYGPDADMVALILCEVIGQARYFAELGHFPDDQRAFTNLHLASWRPVAEDYAERLVDANDYVAQEFAPGILARSRPLGARS